METFGRKESVPVSHMWGRCSANECHYTALNGSDRMAWIFPFHTWGSHIHGSTVVEKSREGNSNWKQPSLVPSRKFGRTKK